MWHPFEHDFFVRISQAFPLLNKLTIYNSNAQKKKLTDQQDMHEQTSSIIEFSHLVKLNVAGSSLDYVEQFLFDFNTPLPCPHTYMSTMNSCVSQHSILQLMLLVLIVQKCNILSLSHHK